MLHILVLRPFGNYANPCFIQVFQSAC